VSSFNFIDDDVLRSNLDLALDHINELVTVSESKNYRNKPVQISSFRKTIIIHIAAIIEAILLWKLKEISVSEKVELADEWRYPDIRILYEINQSEQIIAGKRVKEMHRIDRLDFLQLIRLCCKYRIIKSEQLTKDIDKVRKFRNRQHLGGLSAIEREYSKSDLEFCFSIVERVIKTVSA
jgi:hypothetical protein